MRNGPYELVKAPDGYPGMRYRGLYCYEHHAVYWKHYGVLPGPNEVVHHINEEKRDNRIENLELMSKAAHGYEHGLRSRRLPVTDDCPECGAGFTRYGRGHTRRKFCSRRCAGKMNQRKAKTCRGGRTNPNYSPDGTARV
jgi:hypothetical protein